MNLRKWTLIPLTLGIFAISAISAQAQYLLRNDFEKYYVGGFSSQAENNLSLYDGEGTQSIDIVDNGKGNQQLKITINELNAGMAGITRNGLLISEDFCLKERIYVSDATRRILFRIFDYKGSMETVKFEAGAIVATDGSNTFSAGSYSTDRYYDVKIDVDFSESTYDLYINGFLKGDDLALERQFGGSVQGVNLCEVGHYTKNSTLIDNVEIYTYQDYVIDPEMETFYVSEKGNNLNPGTKARPFETIEAAKQKIMELNGFGVKRSYKIIIKEGTYDSFSIGKEDSPAEGYTVTYEPYPGENVTVTSSKKATGWEEYEEGIYRTKISDGKLIKTLYVNDERAVLARYPDVGYNTTIKATTNNQQCFNFTNGDIPTINNFDGVEAVIWPGGPDGYWAWIAQIKPVTSIDYSKRLVTLENICSYVLGTGSRYYLQNSMDFLNAENEFYYDRTTGYLYYVTSKDINSLDISYDLNSCGIVMEDAERIILKNINVSKTNRNMDGIYINNCKDIKIQDCKVFNTGRHGVFIRNASSEVEISDCEIFEIGDTAVMITGSDFDNKSNTIKNCHIYDTGKIEEHGTAIQISHSGNNLVTNNLIHDTPRYGISLKGISYASIAGDTIDGVKVTIDNYEDFVACKNNVISHNDIYRVNKNSQDSGLIELYGAVQNTVTDNKLHDSSIPFSVGYGVYLDGSSGHNKVTRNLIYNLQNEGLPGVLEYVIFSKGIGNRIHNNVLINNNAIAAVGSSLHTAAEPHKDLEITNNIFYNSGENLYYLINWSEERISKCDNNVYYNSNGKYTLAGNKGFSVNELSDWKLLYNGKYDQNSIVADPLFANLSENDFRLQLDSPVYKVGFENFLGSFVPEDEFILTGPEFKLIKSTLSVRAGVKKLFTDENPSKIKFTIVNTNDEILYAAGFKRKLCEGEEVFVRAGINVENISDDCFFKIYIDDNLFYNDKLTALGEEKSE